MYSNVLTSSTSSLSSSSSSSTLNDFDKIRIASKLGDAETLVSILSQFCNNFSKNNAQDGYQDNFYSYCLKCNSKCGCLLCLSNNQEMQLNNIEQQNESDDCEQQPCCSCKYNFLNQRDQDGMTFLHLASMNHFTKIIEILIENGSNINIVNNEGQTSLHMICNYQFNLCGEENLSLVQYMVNHGVDVNAEDIYGHTAAYYASLHGRFLIVRWFLENEIQMEEMKSSSTSVSTFLLDSRISRNSHNVAAATTTAAAGYCRNYQLVYQPLKYIIQIAYPLLEIICCMPIMDDHPISGQSLSSSSQSINNSRPAITIMTPTTRNSLIRDVSS